MRRVSLLAAAALVAGLTGGASAGTVSGTPFVVQVTVSAGCTINSGPSGTIDFGVNSGTGPIPADIASSVGVTCTNTSPYVIRFTSTNTVTANTDRTMVNGANTVGYQIRQGTTPIGNTNATGFGATGNGALQTTAINFHINSWPTPVPPGVYADNVTLQVDF
jgi:spore coat protein U-like protein